jgi:response regulator NasT
MEKPLSRTGNRQLPPPKAADPYRDRLTQLDAAQPIPSHRLSETEDCLVCDKSTARDDVRNLIVIGDGLPSPLPMSGFRVIGHVTTVRQATELLRDADVALVELRRSTDPTETMQVANGFTPQGPAVVAAAAIYSVDLAHRAIAAGATTFVTAPFTPQRLMAALAMAIARHADTAELRNTIAEITNRLEDHQLIERAKGALMLRHGITEPEAIRSIETAATDRQTSLRAVATRILRSQAATALR